MAGMMSWGIRSYTALVFAILGIWAGMPAAGSNKKKGQSSNRAEAGKGPTLNEEAWKQLQATDPTAKLVERLRKLETDPLKLEQLEKIKLDLLKLKAANDARERAKRRIFLDPGPIPPISNPHLGDWHLTWPPKGQPRMPRLDRPTDAG